MCVFQLHSPSTLLVRGVSLSKGHCSVLIKRATPASEGEECLVTTKARIVPQPAMSWHIVNGNVWTCAWFSNRWRILRAG